MVWSKPEDCFSRAGSSLGACKGDLGGGVLLRDQGEIEVKNVADGFVASAMPFRTARSKAGKRSNLTSWKSVGICRRRSLVSQAWFGIVTGRGQSCEVYSVSGGAGRSAFGSVADSDCGELGMNGGTVRKRYTQMGTRSEARWVGPLL